MFAELRELRSNAAIRKHHLGGKKSFDPKVSQIRKTGIYKCITLILTIQSMYIFHDAGKPQGQLFLCTLEIINEIGNIILKGPLQ